MLDTFVSNITPQTCVLKQTFPSCTAVAVIPKYMSEKWQTGRLSRSLNNKNMERYSMMPGLVLSFEIFNSIDLTLR